MSSDLNSIDEKIINILQADSRKPFVEIAKQIGLSESAVRRRVKNLLDSKAIKKFTIELNFCNIYSRYVSGFYGSNEFERSRSDI